MAAVTQGFRGTCSEAPRHLQIYSPSPLTLFQLKGKFSAKAQQGLLTLSIGHRKEISAGSTAVGWFVASAPPALACSGPSDHSANSDWKEEGRELSHSKSSQQEKKKKRVSKVLQSQLHAEQPTPAQNREHCNCCRRRVNLQAKDQPWCIFLSAGLAQDWGIANCEA